jgi:hypothetical protein
MVRPADNVGMPSRKPGRAVMQRSLVFKRALRWRRASILSRANNGVPSVRSPQGFEWLWRALSESRRLGIGYAIALCWLPILVASDRISARRDAR